MAGVYVRGVKKPYGCTFCPWCRTLYSFCKAANKNISVLEMNKGPDWCPIMEVPDHGDLIDRDALTSVTKMTEGYGEWVTHYEAFEIAEAPVVIPADKEEV